MLQEPFNNVPAIGFHLSKAKVEWDSGKKSLKRNTFKRQRRWNKEMKKEQGTKKCSLKSLRCFCLAVVWWPAIQGRQPSLDYYFSIFKGWAISQINLINSIFCCFLLCVCPYLPQISADIRLNFLFFNTTYDRIPHCWATQNHSRGNSFTVTALLVSRPFCYICAETDY